MTFKPAYTAIWLEECNYNVNRWGRGRCLWLQVRMPGEWSVVVFVQ